MACRRIEQYLSAYLDGQLPAAASRRVERHLEQCERCRTELAELRAVKALLVRAPLPQAPPGMWDAVHAGVREHARGMERPSAGGWAAWFWGRAPVMAAGMAVLLLAAILPIQYLEQNPSRNGMTVDELVARHAGYCVQQPLLEHGRLHYLVAEAGIGDAP